MPIARQLQRAGRMRVPAVLLLALLVASATVADEPSTKHATTIDVIGVTPIDGVGIDRAKFPTNAQRVTTIDGTDAAAALVRSAPATEVNEPQGGPLQADLQFRGFSVSPLLGAPEGIALFQDGVRLNEPFGDTIAWSTVPSSAIDSIEVIPGANPVFGLNALGGALSLRTRSAAQEGSAFVRAGSFGRVDAEAATGGERWFVSGLHVRDGGWRDFSPSDATQLFASTRWPSADLRLTLARSTLTGNGAVPEELLAADRSAVYTHPDQTRTAMAMLSTRQQRAWSDAAFVEATLYARRTRTRTFNGDDSPYEPCQAESGLLCLDDEVVHDLSGSPVAVGAGSPFDGTNNHTALMQTAFGAAVQLDRPATIAGRTNRFIAGASFDGGVARFASSTELAELTEERGTRGSGIVAAESLVDLSTRSSTWSAFVVDILALSPRLTVTSTARLNHVRVRLDDRIETALDGRHSFTQLHPSIGAALAISAGVSVFANVGTTGRTPTPVELSCADPEDPCRLPNAFVSDPPLRAVTARTFEAGARGTLGRATWSAAAYQSVSADDLLFISSGPLRGEGHFANVGRTRRRGIEIGADGRAGQRMRWSASYALVDARFVTPFVVAAPNHPAATDGEVAVEAGDRLPLVPRHIAKLSATFAVTPRVDAGASVRNVAGQFLRGDEGNLSQPLPPYTVLDARLDIDMGNRAVIVFEARNVLDEQYATFGTFGDAADVLGEDYEDSSRFITPAAPRTIAAGVRMRF